MDRWNGFPSCSGMTPGCRSVTSGATRADYAPSKSSSSPPQSGISTNGYKMITITSSAVSQCPPRTSTAPHRHDSPSSATVPQRRHLTSINRPPLRCVPERNAGKESSRPAHGPSQPRRESSCTDISTSAPPSNLPSRETQVPSGLHPILPRRKHPRAATRPRKRDGSDSLESSTLSSVRTSAPDGTCARLVVRPSGPQSSGAPRYNSGGSGLRGSGSYGRASRNNSATWRERRPVKCSICCRQDAPITATSASGWARTCGKSARSPAARELS